MTVVRHFLKWVQTARANERAVAAAALARAYVGKEMAFEDRCEAEAALTFLLDDPSAGVRLALSETLSLSRRAPPQIVLALAADQPDVAAPVLMRSPVLTDGDLIDRVTCGSPQAQACVAARPRISMAVSAAIAETGSTDACLALLANSGAEIASVSFRRMFERHGGSPRLRQAMIADRRLPSDCRHALLVLVGDQLRDTPIVVALMGRERASRLTRTACIKASITLLDGTKTDEHAALVEHLRIRGDLTSGFLLRAVAHGKIDFFGAALVVLSGQGETRVRALLAGGRDIALTALFSKSGLTPETHAPVLEALRIWRRVANVRHVAGPQEVSWRMLQAVEKAEASPARAAVAALLRSIHLDCLRENARLGAMALAAA